MNLAYGLCNARRAAETWSAYDGTQQGDSEKLGEALVKIAYASPRSSLKEIRDYEDLSKSTDGSF